MTFWYSLFDTIPSFMTLQSKCEFGSYCSILFSNTLRLGLCTGTVLFSMCYLFAKQISSRIGMLQKEATIAEESRLLILHPLASTVTSSVITTPSSTIKQCSNGLQKSYKLLGQDCTVCVQPNTLLYCCHVSDSGLRCCRSQFQLRCFPRHVQHDIPHLEMLLCFSQHLY